MTSRERFEAWITAPPYEKNISRLPEASHIWPGQYFVYEVQLAWEAWQARHELDGCDALKTFVQSQQPIPADIAAVLGDALKELLNDDALAAKEVKV